MSGPMTRGCPESITINFDVLIMDRARAYMRAPEDD